jgi:hypothetical protein
LTLESRIQLSESINKIIDSPFEDYLCELTDHQLKINGPSEGAHQIKNLKSKILNHSLPAFPDRIAHKLNLCNCEMAVEGKDDVLVFNCVHVRQVVAPTAKNGVTVITVMNLA